MICCYRVRIVIFTFCYFSLKLKTVYRLLLAFILIFVFSNSFGQWQYAYLSGNRCQFTAVELDGKILLVGGNDGTSFLNNIEVFDPNLDYSVAEMHFSSARTFPRVTVGDSALYILGGFLNFNDTMKGISSLDIYNRNTKTWTVDTLETRVLTSSVVKVGSKIIISGISNDYFYNDKEYALDKTLYIYDEKDKSWTKDSLSIPRTEVVALTNDTIVLFAGGVLEDNSLSSRVDIYNTITGKWRTTELSEAKSGIGGAYHNGKFYFAGGHFKGDSKSSELLEIFDGTNWSSMKLSRARSGIRPGLAGDQLFLAGGGDINTETFSYTSSYLDVDILNTQDMKMRSELMSFDRINHAAIGVGNRYYVIGGVQMADGSILDVVEYWDITTGIHETLAYPKNSILPNPAVDFVEIKPLNGVNWTSVKIFDMNAVLVQSQEAHSDQIDISQLADGNYIIETAYQDTITRNKLIKTNK